MLFVTKNCTVNDLRGSTLTDNASMTTVRNCNATGKHVACYKSFTDCLLLYMIIHIFLRYDRNSIIITFIVVVIMQIIIYGTQLQYITVIATIIVKNVLNSNRTHLCYSQIHKDTNV